MITCEKCGSEFVAHGTQTYPGGTDAPGSHIVYAASLGIAGIACIIAGVFVLRTIMFALGIAGIVGALLSLLGIPEARRLCEQAGGGICPNCGHTNEVKWHS